MARYRCCPFSKLRSPPTSCRYLVVKLTVKLVVKVLSFQQASLAPDLLQVLRQW